MTYAARYLRALVATFLVLAPVPVLGVTLQPGDIVVTSIHASGSSPTLLRVDPITGDREVISGCPDVPCNTVIGTGPGPTEGFIFQSVALVPSAAPANAALSGPATMVLLVGLLLLGFWRAQATS